MVASITRPRFALSNEKKPFTVMFGFDGVLAEGVMETADLWCRRGGGSPRRLALIAE